MKPTCCGLLAKSFQHIISEHSIIAGFRCVKCKRPYIPFSNPNTYPDTSAEDSALLAAGMAFDAELERTL